MRHRPSRDRATYQNAVSKYVDDNLCTLAIVAAKETLRVQNVKVSDADSDNEFRDLGKRSFETSVVRLPRVRQVDFGVLEETFKALARNLPRHGQRTPV